MSDVNANGIITDEVTLYDKDGEVIQASNPLPVTASALPLPEGAATSANQTNGLQLVRVVDADGHQANVQAVVSQISGDEYGVVTNAIVHGLDNQGHWHDVKVTHAGELTTSSTIAGIDEGVSLPVTVTPSDNLTISEFGEQRAALPGNRSDVEFLYDKQPLLFDDISSGGGTVTHRTNERDLLLSINNTTTGTVAGERAHAWIPYTPGNGQEGENTFVADLLNLGGTASVFLRSSVTGTTTLQEVPQAEWLALNSRNWRYSHILRYSFQSLKVGRIQFALVANGIPTKIAEITNDNIKASGYWQSANLPPYWKLYNGATDTIFEVGLGDELNGIGLRYKFNGKQATAQAVAICETVKSQGGKDLFEMDGLPFTTPILAAKTVGNTLIPVLSIRVASTFNGIVNRALVLPKSFEIQTNQPIEYAFYYRPSLTGASWTAINATYHGVEYDNSATVISGGVMIKHGLLSEGTNQIARAINILGKVAMSLGSTGRRIFYRSRQSEPEFQMLRLVRSSKASK